MAEEDVSRRWHATTLVLGLKVIWKPCRIALARKATHTHVAHHWDFAAIVHVINFVFACVQPCLRDNIKVGEMVGAHSKKKEK